MNTIDLFATPIYKTNIKPTEFQYQSLNNLLIRVFDQSAENNWALETGKSTGEHNLYLFRQPEMHWVLAAAMPHVYKFWEKLDYRRGVEIIPTSGWANLHQHGQVTGEHSHCGGAMKAHVSSVFYFKKPVNSGNIEFVNPLEYIHKMSPVHQYDETTGEMYTQIETEQFDFIIFPSWLKHRTQVNKSNEDRIAISINFIGLW